MKSALDLLADAVKPYSETKNLPAIAGEQGALQSLDQPMTRRDLFRAGRDTALKAGAEALLPRVLKESTDKGKDPFFSEFDERANSYLYEILSVFKRKPDVEKYFEDHVFKSGDIGDYPVSFDDMLNEIQDSTNSDVSVAIEDALGAYFSQRPDVRSMIKAHSPAAVLDEGDFFGPVMDFERFIIDDINR